MTPVDFDQARRLAIYGAMIAAQVMEHMRACGATTDDDMVKFVEEADAIVRLHERMMEVVR